MSNRLLGFIILFISIVWVGLYIPQLHFYYTYEYSEGLFVGSFVEPLWKVLSNAILAVALLFVGVMIYRQKRSVKLGLFLIGMIY